MATFLYARRKRAIENRSNLLKEEKITPWLLYFNTGHAYEMTGSDGKIIVIPGKGVFQGKIQQVFWDFMDPILENESIGILIQAQEDVKTFPKRFQKKHLEETCALIQEKLIRGIYEEMVTVDYTLRGRGNAQKVYLRTIEDKLEKADAFVKGQVQVSVTLLNRKNRLLWWRYSLFIILGMFLATAVLFLDHLLSDGLLPVSNVPPPGPPMTTTP